MSIVRFLLRNWGGYELLTPVINPVAFVRGRMVGVTCPVTLCLHLLTLINLYTAFSEQENRTATII